MSILLTKGKASDLLEVLIPLEKISGNAVKRVIDQSQRNLSQVQNIKLIDFAARSPTRTQAPWCRSFRYRATSKDNRPWMP
ncbi:hypothetical protein CM49_00720 [Paenibacillus sp. P1XP2]|nr:hypothetical protein CM49_00720 [Paenibacillus sp. P1XP2]